MGKAVPIFVAFILKLCDVNVFREEKYAGCEPLISSLIFLIAVFLILLKLCIYPECFRKLKGIWANLWDFLIAAFVMEYSMDYFWFPLEAHVISFLCKIADFEQNVVMENGILQLLRAESVGVIISYALSIAFLSCVLYGTRIVDFRKCSWIQVFNWYEFYEMKIKFLKAIGLHKRKSRSGRHRGRRRQTDYDDCDCDDIDIEDESSSDNC